MIIETFTFYILKIIFENKTCKTFKINADYNEALNLDLINYKKSEKTNAKILDFEKKKNI